MALNQGIAIFIKVITNYTRKYEKLLIERSSIMAIVVNTNVSSLMVQKNLNAATNGMNTAMERMSTGLRINSAADDAAGMAVSAGLEKQVRGSVVAQSNAQMGSSLLTVTEGSLGVIQSNLLRIRDLVEQAGNDTYGADARAAIGEEVSARLDEIDRLSEVADFNGIKLLNGQGVTAAGLRLQIGMDGSANDALTLSGDIFASAGASALGTFGTGGTKAAFVAALGTSAGAAGELANVDAAIADVVDRKTQIGAAQNRLTSAMEGLKVQEINLTASNSAIKDADIAVESSAFIKNQILQQASSSLLAQANQAPSIALSLV